MKASQSAGSLGSSAKPAGTLTSSGSLGSLLGKPRSLVIPRGSERAWSSPALAGAYSLRKYAVQVKHLPGERAPRSFQGDQLEIPIHEIDLIGGNGKWRQIKAEEEFKRRRQEEEEQRRQELMKAAQKKRRQAELAERRKRQLEEEERRWQEEMEQKRLAKEEAERLKKEAEDKARRERQEAEEERRRRLPRTCDVCGGSGRCQECHGKGHIFHLLLIGQVGQENGSSYPRTAMEHGRVHQGCENCGGYSHNMLGELKKGTGDCPCCNGTGKIWPVIEPPTPISPKSDKALEWKSQKTTQMFGTAERATEVKINPLSP